MILHCMACSLGGDYIGEHTKVATVDEEALKLPLDSSMFSSYWPERGVPDPWAKGLNWLEMKCPRCGRHPWTHDNRETSRFMEQGGPDWIRTDKGYIYLTTSGWFFEGEELPNGRNDKPDGEAARQIEEATVFSGNAVRDYVDRVGDGKVGCPRCEYRCKPAALKRHITMKHKVSE